MKNAQGGYNSLSNAEDLLPAEKHFCMQINKFSLFRFVIGNKKKYLRLEHKTSESLEKNSAFREING